MLFQDISVPYAASILFELYESNGEFYVQIFYKKTEDENIPAMDIPGCGTKCPLNKLFDIYSSIISTQDFDTQCRLDVRNEYN